MSDLIKRADVIEAIQNAYCKPCKERGDDYNEVRCRACEYDNAIIQIDALPSAEAVEVVRCKDCKYWHSNTEFCDVWSLANIAQRTLADDYCSLAKRREESEV